MTEVICSQKRSAESFASFAIRLSCLFSRKSLTHLILQQMSMMIFFIPTFIEFGHAGRNLTDGFVHYLTILEPVQLAHQGLKLVIINVREPVWWE